ncbi:MAG: hypothetical protein G01um10142_454 [Parcubacteria group bacterium Gr01-1014_2]|nr:MAG: hypothetical protein G01um10142_454 [Parcubacteria group bacterium Gr01-1014_2]
MIGRGFPVVFVLHLLIGVLLFLFLPWYIAIWLMLAFFGYFGVGGLVKIEIGWKGVPLFLGGRLVIQEVRERITGDPISGVSVVSKAIFELKEGWNWILPRPIMGAEAIDVRERPTQVQEFTIISMNGVRLTIKPSTIRWRVENPAQTLSIEERVIGESLVELVQNTLRDEVSHREDDEALRATDEFRHIIQERADRRAVDWGVDVIEFLIGEISLPREVQEDYEKVRREERQRAAEKVELDHVRERLGELIVMGYSRERAQEIIQTERGKVKKEIKENQISISPETGQAFERIASLFTRR